MLKFSKASYSTLGTQIIERYKTTSNKFNAKIKGTFIEKWVKYWNLVIRDYKDVATNTQKDIKEKPLKATLYFSGLGIVGYCMTHNPNMQSFRAKYVQCANSVATVAPDVVNPKSVQHLKYIERSFNGDLLRYLNLGIASIVWVDKYSKDCKTYEANCPYLQVSYLELFDRVVDVGFLNVWWNISKQMLDYDINY